MSAQVLSPTVVPHVPNAGDSATTDAPARQPGPHAGPVLSPSLASQAKEPKAIMKVEHLNATFQPAKIGHPHGLQVTYLKDNSTRNIFVYHEDGKVGAGGLWGWVPLRSVPGACDPGGHLADPPSCPRGEPHWLWGTMHLKRQRVSFARVVSGGGGWVAVHQGRGLWLSSPAAAPSASVSGLCWSLRSAGTRSREGVAGLVAAPPCSAASARGAWGCPPSGDFQLPILASCLSQGSPASFVCLGSGVSSGCPSQFRYGTVCRP